jgi:hypothetical protein
MTLEGVSWAQFIAELVVTIVGSVLTLAGAYLIYRLTRNDQRAIYLQEYEFDRKRREEEAEAAAEARLDEWRGRNFSLIARMVAELDYTLRLVQEIEAEKLDSRQMLHSIGLYVIHPEFAALSPEAYRALTEAKLCVERFEATQNEAQRLAMLGELRAALEGAYRECEALLKSDQLRPAHLRSTVAGERAVMAERDRTNPLGGETS